MSRDFKSRPTVNGVNVLLAGDTVTADTELTLEDFDTGGSTENRPVVGLIIPGAGGAQIVGSTHPLPVITELSPFLDGTYGLAVSVTRVQGSVDTELPAAVTLGDSVSNPTAPMVGSGLMGFNGSTWERVRTANTGRLQVDVVTSASHAVTNAGTFAVQADGSVAAGSADSGNPVKVGGRYNSTKPTLTDGQRGDLQLGTRGALLVQIAPIDATGTPTLYNLATNSSPGDTISNGQNWLVTLAGNVYYNGSTWEKGRSVIVGDGVAGTGIGAMGLYGYNGTNYDRVRVANTGRLQVDVITAPSTTVTNAGTFAVQASGNVASGATDSGNPVKVGGVYNTSMPSPSNGQRVDFQVGGKGSLRVELWGADTNDTAPITTLSGDGNAAQKGLFTWNHLLGFNGTTWDRIRVANTGRLQVDVVSGGSVAQGGDVAHDSADSGNPVKIGGYASSSAPTAVSAAGDRVNAWFDLNGRIVSKAQMFDSSNNPVFDTSSGALSPVSLNSDGNSGSAIKLPSSAYLLGYNGSTWDRVRVANTGRLQVDLDPSKYSEDPINVSGSDVNALQAGSWTVDVEPGSTPLQVLSDQLPTELVGDADNLTLTNNLATSAFLYGYDGSNWDRVRVANTGRLQVDVVTGGGGGTQYVEDVAFGGNGTGTLVVARRDDALSTLTPVEDDAVGLRVNSRGALWVKHDANIVADAGTGPWPVTDNSGSLTVDAPVGTPVFVRLSDGASAISTLAVSLASVPSHAVTNAGTFAVQAAGDVAAGSTDSGNPVKVGGVYNSSFPSLTTGQRGDLQLTSNGALRISIGDNLGSSIAVVAAATGDGGSSNLTSLKTIAHLFAWNGTGYDRVRTVGIGDAAAATGIQASGLMGYNGSTWDRVRTANTGRLQVDVVTAPSTAVTNAGTFAVQADTELPAAAALADAASNPTTPLVGSVNLAYNGTTHDRLRTIESVSTAPNVKTGLLATGVGPGFDIKLNPSNLATALNSAITQTIDGADVIAVHVGTSTTGTIIFETSFDDSAWVTASYVLKVGSDTVVNAAVTPTNGDVYLVRCTGARQFRVRTASTLGATCAIKLTLSAGVGLIKGMDVGPAPHNFGYALTTKTAQYTTTQTGTALWTPATGKKIVVLYYQIQAGGTTAGNVQLWFGASGDTTYTRATDKAVFDGEFAPSSTNKPGVIMPWNGGGIVGAVDDILRVTDSAAINPLTVTVWGYEV